MNDEPSADLPMAMLDRIDRICDRFEAASQRDPPPRVEDYLGEVDAAFQPALLTNLLASEVDARLRRGEFPGAREYHDRFPAHLAAIAAAFDTPSSGPAADPP